MIGLKFYFFTFFFIYTCLPKPMTRHQKHNEVIYLSKH